MNIRPIRNEEDYATAMARIDELWGLRAAPLKVMSWRY